jgi:hypothetical protein
LTIWALFLTGQHQICHLINPILLECSHGL